MRVRRVAVGMLGTAGALVGLVVVGGGWVYAGQLLPAPMRDRTLDITATLTGRGTVLLPPVRQACAERFGLLLQGGSFLIYSGPIIAGSCADDPESQAVVERTVEAVVEGDPPIGRTIPARFDVYVLDGDPSRVGLAFAEVDVPLEDGLGTAPAWLVEGARPETVIIVHGRSGTRGESLRILPAIVEAGYTAMVITHRNDRDGGPDTDDAVGRFGQDEWPDLRAAIAVARDRGAPRIVLMGFSQGASVISYHLRRAGDPGAITEDIAGVVFDSPLLSLRDTLVQQARLRDIPDPMIPPVLLGTGMVARLRAGFDVGDVEHVDALTDLEVPMLLLHGDADDFVPIQPTDDLAEARHAAGRDTTYERIEGAGHVEGYNADAARYTAAITGFLARVMP
ncbi:MAG TPA: alpha/beta fold hydrolase [Euzebya sp.]|nr:alpha/beta fold hydrolase [Euzebya sp.]